MTNVEKYLKDEVDINEFSWEIYKYLRWEEEKNGNAGRQDILNFFEEQAKPTLTEDERVILRNIKSYDTIGRTESGYLIIRDRHTIPMEDDEYAYNSMYCFNHLFKFIKERRRISNTRIIRR